MHRNSQLLFDRYGRSFIEDGARVLEIGPGVNAAAYRSRVAASLTSWDTLDFSSGVGGTSTYQLDEPYTFPIESDSYDVVLSGQVIEHVPKPWRWMPEVARITKPGGHVITIAPVSWPFHEAPVDCWRMYPDGLSALYEDAGLDVLLAEWGSEELEPVVRRLPMVLQRRVGLWQSLSGLILISSRALRTNRFHGAFDTIVVGRKPL
jgi:SAM-dependent methyltransferase